MSVIENINLTGIGFYVKIRYFFIMYSESGTNYLYFEILSNNDCAQSMESRETWLYYPSCRRFSNFCHISKFCLKF